MERKEYIELCRRCAAGDRRATVRYRGCEYKPKGYLLWYDSEGKTKHTAILLDANGNSVVRVLLEKVGEEANGEDKAGEEV